MFSSREEDNRKRREELLNSIHSMNRNNQKKVVLPKAKVFLDRVLNFKKINKCEEKKKPATVSTLHDLQNPFSDAFQQSTSRLMKFGTRAVVNNSKIMYSEQKEMPTTTRYRDSGEKSVENSFEGLRSTSKDKDAREAPRLTYRSSKILGMFENIYRNVDSSIDRGSVGTRTADKWTYPAPSRLSIHEYGTNLDNRVYSEMESNAVTRKGSFRDLKLHRSASKDHEYHTEYNLEARKFIEPYNRLDRGIEAIATSRKYSQATEKNYLATSLDHTRRCRDSVETLPQSHSIDAKRYSPSRERLKETFEKYQNVEYELNKVGHTTQGIIDDSRPKLTRIFFNRKTKDQNNQIMSLNNLREQEGESSECKISRINLTSVYSLRNDFSNIDNEQLESKESRPNLDVFAAHRLFGNSMNESEIISPISYDLKMKSTIISIENCQEIQKLVKGVSLRPLEQGTFSSRLFERK
jgi:hypothetical protein